MTTVEKLQDEILHSSVDDILNMLDAVHAEGVAEGAEQERERMVVILDDYESHHVSIFLAGIRQLLSLPIYDWHMYDPVLAPTKESEK